MSNSRKAALCRWLCLILAGVSLVFFLIEVYIEYKNPGMEYHELRCILSFFLSPTFYLYLLFGLILTRWYRHDGKKERAETAVLVLLMIHTIAVNASPVNALTELLDDLKHTGFSLWEQVRLPISIMITVATGLLIAALIGGPRKRDFSVAGAVLFGVSLALDWVPLALLCVALALYFVCDNRGKSTVSPNEH